MSEEKQNTENLIWQRTIDVLLDNTSALGSLKGAIDQYKREVEESIEDIKKNSTDIDDLKKKIATLIEWHDKSDPADPTKKIWYFPQNLMSKIETLIEKQDDLIKHLTSEEKIIEHKSKSKVGFYTMIGGIITALIASITSIIALLLK